MGEGGELNRQAYSRQGVEDDLAEEGYLVAPPRRGGGGPLQVDICGEEQEHKKGACPAQQLVTD